MPAPVVVRSPIVATVVRLAVAPGDVVTADGTLVVLESMKMEHPVRAPRGGRVVSVVVAVGQSVRDGDVLAELADDEDAGATPLPAAAQSRGEDVRRSELDELHARRDALSDGARPDAVARRRAKSRRTARENIADLCDEGSFEETGSLVIAAQRARRPRQELIERTPADGLVTGIGTVNAALFDRTRSTCAVLAYDYTVLAGTQGHMNHRKKDRLFELVERLRLPVVLFAEGGGGRPGDTDTTTVTGLDVMTFARFGRLSGLVPLVGVVAGYCFAGNAALLGCCDVIIATEDSNIGMGGPAMIEGGGLGTFAPEAIGPIDVQRDNGVVDVVAADEAEAVGLARHYLAYFQGPLTSWDCADQDELRRVLPANRLEVADIRRVAELLFDTGSVLELRRHFAPGMVTALARLEGRPVGVLANDSAQLAGAIDAAGADKAARFIQLCDAFGLPIVSLVDTPGFMVGPDAERTALVRHVSRMFVTGASVTVPWCALVVRRAYGLGAQAMAGGSLMLPLATFAWPSGELGGMGLQGAVQLGFRRELDAVADPDERQALFDRLLQAAYEHGRATNVATVFELDEVIDPAESRGRIAALFDSVAPEPHWRERPERRRPNVDTW